MKPPFRLLTVAVLLAFVVLAAWLLAGTLDDGGDTRPVPRAEDGETTSAGRTVTPPPAVPAPATTTDASASEDEGPEAPRVTLRGRVVDDVTGRGIAGAHVIAGARLARTRATESGDDGSFVVADLAPGTYSLFAWHEDHAPALVEEAVAGRPVEIRLGRGPRLEGRVVDEEGKPVGGARIRFRHSWQDLVGLEAPERILASWWVREADVRTDDAGEFATACVTEGVPRACVAAQARGYVARWSEPVSFVASPATAYLELQVVHACSISGRIRGDTPRTTGEAGVHVEIDGDGRDRLELDWCYDASVDRRLRVGETWRLEGVPPADFEMRARWVEPYLDGVVVPVRGLAPGERREGVDLELPGRAVLRVKLRDAVGRALPGEQVFVRQPADADPAEDFVPWERTDGRGRIELAAYAGVEAEVVHLRPGGERRSLRRLTPHGLEEVVVVSEPSPRTDLEVRVVDADGVPVPRFSSRVCSVVRESDHRLRRGPSSERVGRDGVARHRVVGTAPFEITIGAARDEEGQWLPLAVRWLTIESVPANGVITVTLHARDELRGRVVDAAGGAVPGVRVFLVVREDVFDSAGERRELSVDASGRFVLPLDDDLRRALAHVEVEVPVGYVPVSSIPLEPREGERVVVLRRGGEIAGRVAPAEALGRFAEGEPLEVHVRWQEEGTGRLASLDARVEEDGTWRALGVPPDTELSVGLPQELVRRAGCIPQPRLGGVRAGARDLVLRLVPGETLSGRCLFDPGVPDAELQVVLSRLDGPDSWPLPHAAVSREDGRFRVPGLESGRYRLHVVEGEDMVVLAHRDVGTGEDGEIQIRVPATRSIHVTIEGTGNPEYCTVQVWDADAVFRRGVWHRLPHKSADLRVPLGGAYFVVASVRLEKRVGFAGPVSPGGEITVHLVPEVPLSGRLRRADGEERPFLGGLYARQGGACLAIDLCEDGDFGLDGGVPSGRYDLWYREPGREARCVARDVEAGAEDLDLVVE